MVSPRPRSATGHPVAPASVVVTLIVTLIAAALVHGVAAKVDVSQVIAKDNVFDSDIRDVFFVGSPGASARTVYVTTAGNTYASSNDGYSFSPLSDQLVGCSSASCVSASVCNCVDSIVVSPADPRVAYFLGNNIAKNWVTIDGGKTYTPFETTGFVVQALKPHPVMAEWAIVLTCRDSRKAYTFPECDQDGYVTYDAGKTLVKMGQITFANADWAPVGFKTPNDTIFATAVYLNETGDNVHFVRITPKANSAMVRLVRGGNEFMRAEGFIFVAKVESTAQEVSLFVSNNGYDFTRIQLPYRFTELSYTILDTTEESVFINIQHEECHGHWGSVYLSDSLGVRYSLTLPHNRRKNYNCNYQGDCGVCDFQRVGSLKGIFVANEISNYLDEACSRCSTGLDCQTKCHVQSKITFDKGGEWSLIRPPRQNIDGKNPCDGVDASRCYLHLHGTASDALDDLVASPNAVGLVIASGNVGEFLNTDGGEVGMYLSRDGGVTWRHILKGGYRVGIADHGALLTAVDFHDRWSGTPAGSLQFSWDEGANWNVLNFAKDGDDGKFFIEDIVTSPNTTGQRVYLRGTRAGRGHLMYVDFSGSITAECQNANAPGEGSDYEEFVPRSYEDECLLGEKITYVRRKADSVCYNPVVFETAQKPTPCVCLREDFECDYGFELNPDTEKCEAITAVVSHAPPAWCREGLKYTAVTGYRKVADDLCVSGEENTYIGASIACPSDDSLSGGAIAAIVIMLLLSVGLLFVVAYQKNERFRTFLQGFSARMPKFASNVKYRGITAHPDAFPEEEDFGLLDEEDEENREIKIDNNGGQRAGGNAGNGKVKKSVAGGGASKSKRGPAPAAPAHHDLLGDEEDEDDGAPDFNPRG